MGFAAMPFPGKGVVLVDLTGRTKYGSTYFCDLLHLDHSHISGMSYFDFVLPVDLEAARKLLEENKLPSPVPFPFRPRRADEVGTLG